MSAAEDLLHDLAEHGVTVWQEAGQLRYRAPAGAMTPATMTAMKQHKPELLALLAANDCGGQDRKVTPRVDGEVTGRGEVRARVDQARWSANGKVSVRVEELRKGEVRARVEGRFANQMDNVKVRSRVEPVRTGPLVLVFELDAGMATCIDPVSTSIDTAVADLKRQFPERVGQVWVQGRLTNVDAQKRAGHVPVKLC